MRPLLLLVVSGVAAAGPLTARDGRFVDAMGGTVILRGVNVAGDSKVPPFRPATDPKIFDPLPGWGLNAVRLLFTWEAYEPTQGQYDQTYLDYYRGAVEAAWARGLYVIVDFHQDGFARWLASGCGEGFPEWAIAPGVTHVTPDNGANCVNWGQLVLGDPGVKTTWEAFYSDSDGARSRYLLMIANVAGALAKEPGVIGYDLLNEPYGDEVTQIAPLYELAAPVVRAADPTAILFESPTQLTGGGEQSMLPHPTFDNVAYAPHYYDPGVFLLHGWQGVEPDEPFQFMTEIAQSWNAPLILGEFGAPPSTDEVAGYLDTMYRHLNDNLASAAQWAYTPGWTPDKKDGWNQEDFSIVDAEGAPRANFRPRPFARRIAGVPTSLVVTDRDLVLAWQNDPQAGDSEIFFPEGEAHAAGDVKCQSSGAIFKCRSASAGDKSVHVTKSSPSCGLTGGEVLLIYLLWRRRASSQRRPKRSSGSR